MMSPRVPALLPFERILELHGRAVLKFLTARLGREQGEDCFQETMLAALRAYTKVRDPAAVRSWLFSIAARKATDSRRAAASAAEPVADVERLAVSGDRGAAREPVLWTRVGGLPAKQCQAVTLRYAADLSHREIAAVMRTSEAAARRNVFEGIARLRAALRDG